MRRTLLTLLALGTATMAVVPTMAGAAAKPQITDIVGDANGTNNQGFPLPASPPDTSTGPADVASADIVSVGFKNTFSGKTPTGFTVAMTLSAAPTQGFMYRVMTSSPACATLWFQDDTTAGASQLLCRGSVTGGDVVYPIAPAVVNGSTITWTVPLKAMGHDLKVKQKLEALSAEVRGSTSATYAPVFDQASSNAIFQIGK